MALINQGLYGQFNGGSMGTDMFGNPLFIAPQFDFGAQNAPITNPGQQVQMQAPSPFTMNDYFTALQQNNPIQPQTTPLEQPEGVRTQTPLMPRPTSNQIAPPPPENSNMGQTAAPQPGPTPGAQTPPAQNQFTPQQQAWFNANPGWQSELMKAMLGGQQFGFDPMNIQWQNFNNGATENITRALGVINNPQELAKLLGGEAVTSPFATFGTQQRDQYIRMPNGQMIDASAIGSLLGNAASSQNPFNALSDVIGLMGAWNQQHTNDPNINTDAINLVERGVISPQAPPGWNPANFAGGNPTYTPSGPVPGNPSNPGMGTSNPIQFQNGQMNYVNGPNGFPIFNNTNGNIGTPQMPNPGGNPGNQVPPAGNTPQAPGTGNQNQNAPIGANMNSQYYLPQGRGGLYAQSGRPGVSTMGGGGGLSGGGLYGIGSRGSAGDMTNPFGVPKQSSTPQVAGNLPNGSSIIGK